MEDREIYENARRIFAGLREGLNRASAIEWVNSMRAALKQGGEKDMIIWHAATDELETWDTETVLLTIDGLCQIIERSEGKGSNG